MRYCYSIGLSLLFGWILAPAGRADVHTVVGSVPASYDERHRESCNLDKRLSTKEVHALRIFLTLEPEKDAGTDEELATLKNNVADGLLQQESLPPRLLETFATIFADRRQGAIWREYVVQKLPELTLRLTGPAQQKALGFLRERAKDTDYIFAGTALIGLDRLHSAKPNLVTGNEVAARALAILTSDQHADASKISALQVLARYDAAEALMRARNYLQVETPVMLKVSALATLGLVGQVEDRPVLERYARSPELRLRTSAQAALTKMEARSEENK